MNVEELHSRTVADFAALVEQVQPNLWDDPTPCTDWTVRQLVNHLVYEEKWAVPLFAGATIAEVGDRFEGDLLGDEPVDAVRAAAEEAISAVAAPGAVGRTVHLSFGETPGEEYARQLSADHLIHAWDLARATGLDDRLDPELVAEVAAWFADREAGYRAGGVIGPAVPITGDDPQDRLIAAFGRDPAWRADKP